MDHAARSVYLRYGFVATLAEEFNEHPAHNGFVLLVLCLLDLRRARFFQGLGTWPGLRRRHNLRLGLDRRFRLFSGSKSKRQSA